MAEDIKESLLSTFNLAKIASDAGLMRTILHMHDVGKMGCVPAIVVEYDYATKIAKVLPLVKFLKSTTDGLKGFDRPFYKVPVYSISQGGFRIDLPLFTGNTGMLFAVDREWETAKSDNSSHLVEEEDPKNGDKNKNKGSKDPDSLALADFQFGFFLPMTFGGGSENDKGKIVLKRITEKAADKPSLSIEVSDGGIKASLGDSVTSEITKDGSKVQVTTEENGTILSEINGSSVKVSIESDSYTFDKNGLIFSGKVDEVFSAITNIRYDLSSHQIQKKTREMKKRGTFIVSVGKESGWTMIDGGQAEPQFEA